MATPLSVHWSCRKTHIGPILLRVPRSRRSRGTGGLRTQAGQLVLPCLGAKRAENRQGPALEAFGLHTDDSDDHEAEDQRAVEALLRSLARVVEAEASHLESTEYERMARRVIVRRGEAQLVALYRQTLPESKALLLSVGRTDLYLVEEGDLGEASSLVPLIERRNLITERGGVGCWMSPECRRSGAPHRPQTRSFGRYPDQDDLVLRADACSHAGRPVNAISVSLVPGGRPAVTGRASRT
jgi:hypothetical protein